jgi:futalosine hydrolase
MNPVETFPMLVVSATEAECAPTLRDMTGRQTLFTGLFSGTLSGQPIEVLISGVGSVATTFRLTQILMQRRYSHAISIGIAGSFADDIPIGETVQITKDCFADLGIDNNGQFLHLHEAGLTCNYSEGDFLINPSPTPSPHRKVRGVTVQTTSGSRKRIAEIKERFHPQVETMENAAFFYVCRQMQIPFASFRTISNKVEPRNRENWHIEEAIKNMNESLIQIIRNSLNSARNFC